MTTAARSDMSQSVSGGGGCSATSDAGAGKSSHPHRAGCGVKIGMWYPCTTHATARYHVMCPKKLTLNWDYSLHHDEGLFSIDVTVTENLQGLGYERVCFAAPGGRRRSRVHVWFLCL